MNEICEAHWYLGGKYGIKEKEVVLSSVKIYPPNLGTIPVDLSLWHDHGGKWPSIADIDVVLNTNNGVRVQGTQNTACQPQRVACRLSVSLFYPVKI